MFKSHLCAVLAVTVVVTVTGLFASQQAPLTRTRLLQAPIPDSDTREAVMVRVELAPGSSAGKHYHHGTEIGYVLNGGAILEIEGKAAMSLKAGDSFQIDPGRVHNVSTSGASLTVLSVYLIEKGKPLAEPGN